MAFVKYNGRGIQINQFRGILLIPFEGAASASMALAATAAASGGSAGAKNYFCFKSAANRRTCCCRESSFAASLSYPFALIAEGMEMGMPLLSQST